MNRKQRNQGHAGRVQTGKLVLAAAESVDTTLVASRLAAFSQLHSQFLEAMTRVNTAQTTVDAATDQVTHHAALLDAALDKLIAQLVVDGHPRLNPFTVYTADTPSSIKLLTPADRSTTVHRLLSTIQRDERLSPGSRDAAITCAAAATAVDTALTHLDSVDDAAEDARNARDATADRWDDALAALKRGARAAADDGAAGLYAALFDRIAKPTSSKPRTPRSEQPARAA